MSRKKYQFVVGLAVIMYSNLVLAADPTTFKAHMIDSHANSDGPDYVQHQAAGNGWFSNLGPTGIRAMLTGNDKYRNYMLQINDQLKRNGTRFNNQYRTAGFPYGNVAMVRTLRP